MNEDKSTRYRRLHRRASVAAAGLAAAFLVLLLATGASSALRDALDTGIPWLTLVAYVIALAMAYELVQLPLSYYKGVTLERRYGLSTQPVANWWIDQAKAGLLGLALTVAGAAIVWGLLRWSPERWWIAATACFAVVLVALAQLAPVLLMPLFYDFKPLDRAALAERLESLATRAGARVLGVFEWRLHDRTRAANAALAGIGRTRRILLSDTLLAAHSDDEIEVILAHELGHHVHRDLWSSLVFESALIALGFFAADRALTSFAGSFGLTGKGDMAALPLLPLSMGAISVALLPLANALSRVHERRADRYALKLTNNAAAFISAMKRLGVQNLAEEEPTRLVELLFYTHPPMNARIEAARSFEQSARSRGDRRD
jgi:STE24 endopeptidase